MSGGILLLLSEINMPKIDMWEIKHRPSTIDQYIFQNDSERQSVEGYIANKSFPHLLLAGHHGTGKTSLAYLLKRELEISDSDFLVINASDENSVDTVRTKIKNFISSYAMSAFKIVFLDEADSLTPNAQDALRNMMEEYADNARFILTCNKPAKIMNALKSRCRFIEFKSLDRDNFTARLVNILQDENVVFKLKVLNQYIDAFFPDCRKTIQMLQHGTRDGKLRALDEISDDSKQTEIYVKIADLMAANQYMQLREFLSTNLNDNEWEDLYRFLYESLNEIGKFAKDDKKWLAGTVIIADHLYKHSIVADPEINAFAMFIRLGEV